MSRRLLLRGGIVHGPPPTPPALTDILLDGARVAAIGADLAAEGAEVVSVAGLHVSPGFLDMHSHSDVAVIADPVMAAKTRQGITLDVVGQDGLGVAPFDAARDDDWRQSLLALTGHADRPWTWHSFADHLDAIASARPAVNVAAYVTYGAVRNAVLGLSDRAPDAAELAQIESLVDAAMASGAFGMSVGLVYPPAVFASSDELVRAFAVVGRRGGLMVVHLRSQGDAWLEALDEAIAIAGRAEVALHVSHLCALGRRNWVKIPQALDRLAAARAAGLPVTFDQHPYAGASTTLAQVLPPWVVEGGPARLCERLGDTSIRDRIRVEMAGPGRLGWENYAGLAGWDNVQIGGVRSAGNAMFVGRTIGAVAAERQADPFDVAADLLIAEAGSVPMVLLGMYDDQGILEILRAPGGSVGTDGVIAPHPHPRLYGSTARVLGRYVRELGGLALTDAVDRLGGAGARILGLRDRGTIAQGAAADLVVFDPALVADRASYDEPRQHPAGIVHVLVNGGFAVRDGQETGERHGVVLRRGAEPA